MFSIAENKCKYFKTLNICDVDLIRRNEDIKTKKHHIAVVNRTPLEPAPVIVAVVGGAKVGKTTLIRSLVKNYTQRKVTTLNGPITVIAGSFLSCIPRPFFKILHLKSTL